MRIAPLLLVLLLLSGCAGSSKGPSASPTTTEEPPLVPPTADYGGVEGFLYNEDVLPQANATIQVEGLNKSAVTDAIGYYVLMPMEPGSYFLVVNETGYLPIRRAVSVLAGQGHRLDFSLRQVPVPEPYIDDSFLRRGQINCQARVNASTTNTNPDCTEAGQQYTGAYLPPGRGANLTIGPDAYAMLIELEWQSSIASNERLRIAIRSAEGAESWKQVEGSSLLRVEVNEKAMLEFAEFAGRDYRANGGQIFFLIFAGEAANQGTGGAGATVQQDYTLYVTVFYRMDIPEKYSRLTP